MNIALPPETREQQIERVYKLGFERGKKQARKEIKKRLENLIDKKRTKQLADSLEMVYGERKCKICGCEPEKQRKMILKQL